MARYEQWITDQDDCLIAMETGKKPPMEKLKALPPWRAVLIARICNQGQIMTDEEVEEFVQKAREVGGSGRFETNPQFTGFTTIKDVPTGDRRWVVKQLYPSNYDHALIFCQLMSCLGTEPFVFNFNHLTGHWSVELIHRR